MPIQLFPEEVWNMDLQFNVTLIVPRSARSQGVVLGEPNVATVIVPATGGAYIFIIVIMYSNS